MTPNAIRALTGLIAALMLISPLAEAQAPPGAAAGLEIIQNIEPIDLTESDIERFLAASKDFDEADIDLGTQGTTEPPTQAEMIKAVEANSEAMAILDDHGFTPKHFSDVTMNIVLAVGAAEMAANRAEIDQAMQQMEAMKDQLPPAQYEAIRQQIVGVQTMFAKAPAANIELVQRYRPQLEALGD
jgi:hypothetical protein